MTDGVEVFGDRAPIETRDPNRKSGPRRREVARRSGGGRGGGAQGAASRSRRARFRSTPHRYPESPPPVRTTRWHGMATARGFDAHARATARAAPGAPMRSAISP